MPLSAATGPIALTEHAGMVTLAAGATFQTWVGAANETAAKNRIHFDWLPAPAGDAYTPAELAALFPAAVIFTPERGKSYSHVRDSSECWDAAGTVMLDLYCLVTAGTEASAAFRDFKNVLGGIITNLATLAHQSPDSDHMYLAIERIDLFGPHRASEEEAAGLGDFLVARLALHWGQR